MSLGLNSPRDVACGKGWDAGLTSQKMYGITVPDMVP